MGFDFTNVVEAAYRVTLPEIEWIDGVLAACAPALAGGQGTFGYLYDASGSHLRVLAFRSTPRNIAMERAMTALVESVPREYVARTWLKLPFAITSSVEGSTELLAASRASYRDVLAINGFDATGLGFWVGTTYPRRTTVSASVATAWTRVAAHLGAAFRVRRTLAGQRDVSSGADAILEPDGTIAHAQGDAREPTALQALRAAVLRVARARERKGERRERALAEWKGLVEARWTLLDHFDRDGRRFLVAQSNEPSRSIVQRLTSRERQVLACLAIGHTTKVVAYELGLADATVRVLVQRAVRKLGVHSRREAIARMQALLEAGGGS